MNNAVIWGAAGGLGQALVAALRAEDWQVHAVTRNDSAAVGALTPHCYAADVADAQSVQRTVQAIAMETSDVALSIYAVGDIASLKLEALDAGRFCAHSKRQPHGRIPHCALFAGAADARGAHDVCGRGG